VTNCEAQVSARDGFTLLEIILVITLLGIVLALALPRIGSVGANYLLDEEASQLINAISSGRLRAIKNHIAVRINIDPDHANTLLIMQAQFDEKNVAGYNTRLRSGQESKVKWDTDSMRAYEFSFDLAVLNATGEIIFYPKIGRASCRERV